MVKSIVAVTHILCILFASQFAVAQKPPAASTAVTESGSIHDRALKIIENSFGANFAHYGPGHVDKTVEPIQNEIQLEAMEIGFRVRSSNSIHDIPAFANFETHFQLEALRIAGPKRGQNIYNDYKTLLEFKNDIQIEALRIGAQALGSLVSNGYGYFLSYTSQDQLDVLAALADQNKRNLTNHLEWVREFENPTLVKMFRERTITDATKDVMHIFSDYVDIFAAEYAAQIPHRWTAVEDYIKDNSLPADKWHKVGLQKFLLRFVDEFTAAEGDFAQARIKAIANAVGIPEAELCYPAYSFKVRSYLKDEFAKVKNAADFLKSPFVEEEFLKDRTNYAETIVYLLNNREWFLALPMTDLEFSEITKSKVFKNYERDNKLMTLRNDLIKDRLLKTTTLKEFFTIIKLVHGLSPGYRLPELDGYNPLYGHIASYIGLEMEHFQSLPMTYADLCTVIGQFGPSMQGETLKVLIRRAFALAPNVELLYKIPVKKSKLKDLGILDEFRERQEEFGETWYNRKIGFPTNRRLKDTCRLKMGF